MSARRSLALVVVVAVTAAGAWVSWPGNVLRQRGGVAGLLTTALPAATIHVARGGHAVLVTPEGAVPLPETVVVTGGTPATIRFENGDSVAHRLGLFGVPAGQSREYTIAHAGTYGGYCSAHPARRLTYVVR
jgi:plastocyanin